MSSRTMAVVTPSYSGDYELCRSLHQSVLRWGSSDLVHHIVVPRQDVRVFSSLRGPRCQIWPVDVFLPRTVRQIPRANVWVNGRRPWPPVRGWIMQQIMKLAAATRLDPDVLLFVDSDIEFVRPFSSATYLDVGRLPLYRRLNAVDESLPRHVLWHQVARRLLGRASTTDLPLPDYISPLNAWDAHVARGLLTTVSEATSRHWVDALCGEAHLSEYILYGVYVDEVLGGAATVTATMRCHNYWDERPLDSTSARRFVQSLHDDDVAVMISAKSRTPLSVRRAAFEEFAGTGRRTP